MTTNVSNPARCFEVLPHPPRFLPVLHPSYTYLVGLETDHAFARYCVMLSVFVDIVRQLDPEPRERLLAALPAVAVDDLLAAREARSRYRIPWLSKLQSLLYDSYLKSQGVGEGIRNYSSGVVHFAQAWRKRLVRIE